MVHNTDIIKPNFTSQDTNVLTKFHEDWATELNKTRVLTRFYYSRIRKNAPPHWKPYWTINVASRVLTRKNTPPLFHDDRKINVTSSVLTRVFPCFHYIHMEKTAKPPGGHVFSPIWTIFELVQDRAQTSFELGRDFIGAKLLTKFHENGTRNVASRVFKSKCLWTDGRTYDGQRPVRKAHLSNQLS
ncbi:hypothetical protein DPMN_120856 [Dreissena polymorpha]|uniref:Uncharacterized protein n=1 Tax=Dreissena polymorpha TaxID=45954 RepID=A0A9D4JSJ5_DREPO|nr:hypothetical protein DPMN_120856 [Dreissena polymorpha]